MILRSLPVHADTLAGWPRRGCLLVLALLISGLLGGCSSLRYYQQAVAGQLDLMWSARPVREVIADPDTDPALHQRLEQTQAVRRFARDQLALPVGDAYRDFVALDRPYVVVNVVAVPEFSLQPHQWCYPVVGCQAYRGYFDPQMARAEARTFRDQGFDTLVSGVTAYSTLGWFDDPLHSGFTRLPSERMAALLFHELAHRVVYVAGDTAFNESFATAVELAGLELWLSRQGEQARFQTTLARLERRDQTLALVAAASEQLQALYQSEDPLPPEQLRQHKARILSELRQTYLAKTREWHAPGPFGLSPPVFNNAHLALFRQYNQYLPAFRQLLREHDHRFADFYEAVKALATQPPAQRQRRLHALAAAAAGQPDPDHRASD